MLNSKIIHETLIKNIRNYFQINNIKKAVVGLSGGIDSSLCAKLVADAIGKENVHGILMPLKGLSADQNVNDAIELCKQIGIKYDIVPINDFVKSFEIFKWQNKIARMNTSSRIRAVILYNYANSHNALVIGTSNKTEIKLGYFTKYGDGAVDIEVISDLYKTDEVELAKYLNLPSNIITKTPTAELFEGQTDEDELGATYKEIDEILKKLDNKEEVDENDEKVRKILKRVKDNGHKNMGPVLVKIDG